MLANVISLVFVNRFTVDPKLTSQPEHFATIRTLKVFDLVMNGLHVEQQALLVAETSGAQPADELSVQIVDSFLVKLQRPLLSETLSTLFAYERLDTSVHR